MRLAPLPLLAAAALLALPVHAGSAPSRAAEQERTEPLHQAEPAPLPSECRRFTPAKGTPPSEADEHYTAPLARLCVRLLDAEASAAGLSETETAAATRLGEYLAVLGRLELRIVLEDGVKRLEAARRTTETARYLIARRMGLFAYAEALAPAEDAAPRAN